MRLHLDPHQPHQLEAVAAVVDALRGQPRLATGPAAARDADGGRVQALHLDDARLLANVRAVQARHGLPPSPRLDARELTVEMETGTGKTYAYLRALRELYARYGLSRFVVVVPGVAVREGVLGQLALTADHLDRLYPGAPVRARAYRPGEHAELRRFAADDGVQILVLNIDAFNKGAGNLAHRPADALGGRAPLEVVAGTRPVVVLDEPQSMEGPRGREALAALRPLLTLRWSATHRRAPNLLYRLDPVRAWDLGLVKRIEVASVVADGEAGPPPLELKRVRATTRGVAASLALEARAPGGTRRKTVTVRGEGEDLHALSGGHEAYRGWVVERVDADPPRVVLAGGVTLAPGAPLGHELRADVMRRQVEEVVRLHLEAERRVHRLRPPGRRLKVLSLLFVARVAHYADRDGPVRRWLEEAWTRLAADPRYADLALPPAARVHAGYFAERRGRPVDSTGRSREDEEAFALIMRDKARLLSPEEPVRVLVSHSALREGWDNPNVFQIGTLHPTRSELRKRQEIGRGLRLPVAEDGHRCRDPDLARLTVVANESYEAFARELQAEIRRDCGVDVGARVEDRRARRVAPLAEGWRQRPALAALWQAVARPVAWRPELAREELVAASVAAVRALPAPGGGAVRVDRVALHLEGDAVRADPVETARFAAEEAPSAPLLPDPLAFLQQETGLTRATVAEVLRASGRLPELRREPMAFLEACAAALSDALRDALARGAVFAATGEPAPPLELLEDRPLVARSPLVPVTRAPWSAVPAGGPEAAARVAALEADPAVAAWLPWPPWLRVASPLGPLDAGWAALRRGGDGVERAVVYPPAWCGAAERACLVRHFAALGVQVADSRVTGPAPPG